jgi:hypothetical protein
MIDSLKNCFLFHGGSIIYVTKLENDENLVFSSNKNNGENNFVFILPYSRPTTSSPPLTVPLAFLKTIE